MVLPPLSTFSPFGNFVISFLLYDPFAKIETEKLNELQGLIMTTAFAAPAVAAAGAITAGAAGAATGAGAGGAE